MSRSIPIPILACISLLIAAQSKAQLPDTLTLSHALARALAPGRSEQVAAAAQARLPGSPLRPELDFSVALGRSGRSFGEGDETSASVEVARRFDPWGRARYLRESSVLERRAATALSGAVARDIALEVRQAFHRAGLADRHRALLGGLTSQDRARVAATQARVRDGDLTPLAGRLADLDLLDSETRLEQSRSETQLARAALAAAMGVPAESLATRALAASDRLDTLELSAARLEEWTRSRPELVAARQRAEASERAHRATQLAGRPEFTVGLELEVVDRREGRDVFLGDPGGLEGLASRDQGVRLRVSAPWHPRENARVEQAVASALATSSAALAQSEERRAVGTALAAGMGFASEARLARQHRARLASITDDLARVSEAYRDGRIALETWLTYQQRLHASLAAAFEAEARYWDARAALEAAVGVSFEELQAGERR